MAIQPLSDISGALLPDGHGITSLKELEDSILRALREDIDDPIFWSRIEIEEYINDAYAQICKLANIFIKTGTIRFLEGVRIYELPLDCSRILKFDLNLIEYKNRDKFKPNIIGTPSFWDYYGVGKIIFDATPNEVTATGEIDFEYRALPPKLSNPGDTINDNLYIKKAIRYYALYSAFDKEGDGHDDTKSTKFYARFEQELGKLLIWHSNLEKSIIRDV